MNASNSIDLDINNYTIGELMNFFKLDSNYSFDDLDDKEGELISNILKLYNDTNVVYRNEIIGFIKTGKQVLSGKIQKEKRRSNKDKTPSSFKTQSSTPATVEESEGADITNKMNMPIHSNLFEKYNNVGKIINPTSNHPALQTQSIPSNSINGYNLSTNVSNYIYNTRFRDNYFNTSSSNCSFTLPNKIKNVIAINLAGIQIPNVSYTFSSVKETNQLYIYEDNTGLNAIVTIPSGNYNINTFATALEKAINEQVIGSTPNRFTVTINNNSNTINIINSTNTFRINILKKINSIDTIFDCAEFDYSQSLNSNYDEPVIKKKNIPSNCINSDGKNKFKSSEYETADIKKKIKPSDYFTTMGYLMGFRQIEYVDSKSYTCEAPFDNTLQDYYYFELNDYNDYQNESTYGVLPTYILSKNIIAVLPITTPKYISTFDNNSNDIYKTRNYNSPVDISKISIKLLSADGVLVDLHSIDFAFILQVTTIYDNMLPYKIKEISVI